MEHLDPTLGPSRHIVDFYGESDPRRTASSSTTDESMVSCWRSTRPSHHGPWSGCGWHLTNDSWCCSILPYKTARLVATPGSIQSEVGSTSEAMPSRAVPLQDLNLESSLERWFLKLTGIKGSHCHWHIKARTKRGISSQPEFRAPWSSSRKTLPHESTLLPHLAIKAIRNTHWQQLSPTTSFLSPVQNPPFREEGRLRGQDSSCINPGSDMTDLFRYCFSSSL